LRELSLGMIARVALGHTGRLLVAPRAATTAFVAIKWRRSCASPPR